MLTRAKFLKTSIAFLMNTAILCMTMNTVLQVRKMRTVLMCILPRMVQLIIGHRQYRGIKTETSSIPSAKLLIKKYLQNQIHVFILN